MRSADERIFFADRKDSLIVFESGWIAFFDHEDGVTVAEPPNWRAEQGVDDQTAAAVESKAK